MKKLTTDSKVSFESLIQPHWSEEELNNVLFAIDLMNNTMNERKFEYISSKYKDLSYKQYNRAIPDRIPGLMKYVKELTKTYPDYTYSPKQIMADGDKVIFHAHVTLKEKDLGDDTKGFIVMDIWEIKGKEVKHWDSLQALNFSMRFGHLLLGGKIKNENGIF
ncbi:MAG: polyketide cyclase [Aureispira sp.]|nr:polyketide cyclase [Aureispira sp.]